MDELKDGSRDSTELAAGQTIHKRDWATQPPLYYPAYKSTGHRHPKRPLVSLAPTLSELTGPKPITPAAPFEADLTRNARLDGEPLGERIVVSGRVLDDHGTPIPGALIEIWQANAAGRYAHTTDQHNAPLDPNFLGAGRCTADDEGRYAFTTIKPGAYPWGNHYNGWRPAHIHLSIFGACFASRLVTQFYFPGDPLLDLDPIFNATPRAVRNRLIARFSLDTTVPSQALGYEFDLVLRGLYATPMES